MHMPMRLGALCSLLMIAHLANAQSIGVHTISKHAKDNHKYNNNNYGLYYRTEKNYVFGFYENSFGDTAVYGAEVWEKRFGPVSVGATAGLVAGYERFPILPLAGVSAGVHIGKLTVRPNFLITEQGFLKHLTFEWRF